MRTCRMALVVFLPCSDQSAYRVTSPVGTATNCSTFRVSDRASGGAGSPAVGTVRLWCSTASGGSSSDSLIRRCNATAARPVPKAHRESAVLRLCDLQLSRRGRHGCVQSVLTDHRHRHVGTPHWHISDRFVGLQTDER